jgi:prepilin-type N-terminal cleavage/methylation domain-containing protein
MGPLSIRFRPNLPQNTGTCPRAPCAGFTLVEILVVLLVLALAAGLAYARESDPRHDVEREGRRLAAAVEHAASPRNGATRRSVFRSGRDLSLLAPRSCRER